MKKPAILLLSVIRSIKCRMTDIFHQLMHEAMARGTKSSALQPLLWLFSICTAALPGLAAAKAPTIMLGVVAVAWMAIALVIVGVYLFLLFTNPDALRSEHLTMYKMAMEKSLIGDDIHGLVKSEDKHKQIEEKAVNVEGTPL